MEWSLIITGSILFLCSIYIYIKSRYKIATHQREIVKLESELKKTRESEQLFKEEINILNNKLSHTFTDTVTDLLGWSLFEDRLMQNFKESQRYQLNMGVLYVDIDDFKLINDALGYEFGDILLREVAERLRKCVRQVDSLTRITKDIFVVLLPQLSKPETAALVAQRILRALSEPFQINKQELYITACIGIAVYPTDGGDVQTLLRNADHALHLAKTKDKNIYQFAQEKLHSESQRELILFNNLNREFVYREFLVYFQPIVDVKKETIFCLDALLYWNNVEVGLIGPDELFDYAEKQRKSNMITEWMLQTICKQVQHWQSFGFNPKMIGIPITFKQLETSHFIYRISQILQERSFNPKQVLLEIKESPLHLPREILDKAFNMLEFIGVSIAIDNFGTSHFPLHYLKEFKVQYLRLDKSLTDDILTNSQTVSLIKSLVALADNLSMRLIVQGIESEEQVTILKELNCIFMQGNLLGGPIAPNEVPEKVTMAV